MWYSLLVKLEPDQYIRAHVFHSHFRVTSVTLNQSQLSVIREESARLYDSTIQSSEYTLKTSWASKDLLMCLHPQFNK